MARVFAALLLVTACDKGVTTRLYTDDEIAAIEKKASLRASRHPDSVTDVSILSLGGLMKELEAVRKEPNASLAASRAVAQLPEVRRLEGEQSLGRMFVVQSGERAIADALDEILRRGGLQGAELDALAAAIDHVIATEPHMGPAFEGNLRWLRGSILYRKPFTPSGGAHDARDEIAMTLAMLDEIEPRLTSACPPGASLSTCHRQLPARTAQLILPGMFLSRAADQIRASDDSTRRRLQSDLTHQVAMNQLGGYPVYVERAAADVSRLIALRVQIELLRKNACHVPTHMLSSDGLGEPVRLTRLDRSLRIEPPTWATTGARSIESWTFPCP